MNYTYVYQSIQKPIVFADFENELWSIIILCVLILTRGIVSSLMRWFGGDEYHHHVHYSNEYSTLDLNLQPKPKPPPAPKGELPKLKVPPNSPVSEFDPYEKKPKIPPRDELV